jgi:hypothetical protein
VIGQYGSYTFAQNEISTIFRQEYVRDSRNFRRYIRKTIEINGKLHASSADALTTAMNTLDSAFSVDGRDFTLFTDGGTATHHRLLTGAAIGGVRVMRGPSYEPGDGGEYTTYRSYNIMLEADYLVPNAPNVMEFEESVTVIGSGGPRIVWRPVLVGDAKPQLTTQKTLSKTVQSGTAMGHGTWPFPPNPLWPEFELAEERNLVRHAPKRNLSSLIDYRISWSYAFTRGSSQLIANPTLP